MNATLPEVEATLGHYARVTREEMRRYLPAGGLHEIVRDYPERGGHGLRPALLLATCQAYGGSIREGVRAAATLELLHNAFLIHDDLEDGSELRRGRPTLQRLHGVPLAVNAGDALATLAFEPLRDHRRIGARISRRVFDELLAMVRQATEGQALELHWRRDNVIALGPADYLTLVGKKTCSYTTVGPLRLGALIGARGAAGLERLTRFGFYLGAAFQIRDDLLNLLDVEEHSGKEAYGDLREGKRTLPLLHLLEHASPAQRDWVTGFLGSPEDERSSEDVGRLRDLMDHHGSIAFAQAYGEGVIAAAERAMGPAFADLAGSPHLAFLRGVVPYMLARRA